MHDITAQFIYAFPFIEIAVTFMAKQYEKLLNIT